MDKYELHIHDSETGLWGTNPEALLGHAYLSIYRGFKQGQVSVLFIVKSAIIFNVQVLVSARKPFCCYQRSQRILCWDQCCILSRPKFLHQLGGNYQWNSWSDMMHYWWCINKCGLLCNTPFYLVSSNFLVSCAFSNFSSDLL